MISVNSVGAFSMPATREKNTVQPKFELPETKTEEIMEEKNAAEINSPSYEISDSDAEYFREKYGEKYDDSLAPQLYDELAEKDIIDSKYFSYASGYGFAMPLTGLKCRGCFTAGGEDIYGLGRYCSDNSIGFVSDKIFFKDVSRTDDNAYKAEWDKFIEEYDREKETWQDYLRETIDFEKYLKETAQNSVTGKHYPTQEHFNDVIENLEKTMTVLEIIFGTEDEL